MSKKCIVDGCENEAYQEIKGRKGVTKNGTFIKKGD